MAEPVRVHIEVDASDWVRLHHALTETREAEAKLPCPVTIDVQRDEEASPMGGEGGDD